MCAAPSDLVQASRSAMKYGRFTSNTSIDVITTFEAFRQVDQAVDTYLSSKLSGESPRSL
jgi:hypothetical protein